MNKGLLVSFFIIVALGVVQSVPLLAHFRRSAPQGPAALDLVEQWLGRSLDIGHDFNPYEDWTKLSNPNDWQLAKWGAWIKAKPGRQFLYSVNPWPRGWAGDLASCAAGSYNNYYVTLATNMKTYGLGSSIVRFGWEWSGDWFPWSAKGKEAQYAGCFRSFVNSFRSVQNTTFKFDWNANGDFTGNSGWRNAFPGKSYVNYVGVDQYDLCWDSSTCYPYPSNCDENCKNTRRLNAWNQQVSGINTMRDFAKENGLLLSISEWGLWGKRDDGHSGFENPIYIQKMFEYAMDPDNVVGYLSYFDTFGDADHQISDVSDTPDRSHVTAYPVSAAKYKQLFSTIPKQNGGNTSNSSSSSSSSSSSPSSSSSSSAAAVINTYDNFDTFPRLQGNSAHSVVVSLFLAFSGVLVLLA